MISILQVHLKGRFVEHTLHWSQSSDLCVLLQVETEPCTLVPTAMAFLENHGKNIQLSNQNLTAARVSSYNQGLLVTAQPLARQQLFQVAAPSAPPPSARLVHTEQHQWFTLSMFPKTSLQTDFMELNSSC